MAASTQPDIPSRYRTKRKPTYTRAEPVSLSARIISIGTPTTRAAYQKSRTRDNRKPCRLIRLASSNEVEILEISAGWNLTGPSSNQEWEPFTSFDTKITSTKRKATPK